MDINNIKVAAKFSTGFTLVELMIVVLVLAIIISIGVPAFAGFISSQRVEANQRVFVSNLQFTQSEAVTSNTTVTMCIAANATSCDSAAAATWNAGWHIFIDNNGDGDIDAGETIVRSQAAIPGMSFVPSPKEEEVTFGTTGQIIFPSVAFGIAFCQHNSANLDCTDPDFPHSIAGVLLSGQIVAQPLKLL